MARPTPSCSGARLRARPPRASAPGAPRSWRRAAAWAPSAAWTAWRWRRWRPGRRGCAAGPGAPAPHIWGMGGHARAPPQAARSAALDAQRWRTLAEVLRLAAGARALGAAAATRALAAAAGALDAAGQEALVPLLGCLRELVAGAACRPRWARWACRRGRARATASCWRPCWRRCCARPGRPWPTPGARSPPAASPPPSWSSRSRRSSSSWQTRPAGARPARRRRAPACPPARPRQQPTTSAVWRRAALHGPGGPLQWAAAQLLDVGARSPTTAALTALHLSALWLRCPQAAPAYVGAWLRLLLLSHADHGSAGHQPGLQVAPAPRPRPRRPPNP